MKRTCLSRVIVDDTVLVAVHVEVEEVEIDAARRVSHVVVLVNVVVTV